MFTVKVYDIWNNTYEWKVPTREKAREHAKRIIMEGFWTNNITEEEVMIPVHNIVKVKIFESK